MKTSQYFDIDKLAKPREMTAIKYPPRVGQKVLAIEMVTPQNELPLVFSGVITKVHRNGRIVTGADVHIF